MKPIKQKKCALKECGESFTPYKSTDKFCSGHCYYKSDDYKNKQLKQTTKNLSKKPFKFVKKSTGEKIVFEQIWNERPHVSQISGEPIREAKAINFMHVLAKGQNKYPKFKLLKQNILLVTDQEHHYWDNQRDMVENDARWLWVYQLENDLKEKYKAL